MRAFQNPKVEYSESLKAGFESLPPLSVVYSCREKKEQGEGRKQGLRAGRQQERLDGGGAGPADLHPPVRGATARVRLGNALSFF